jgi:hypothetical protein
MRLLHVVPSYYPAVRYGGPIYSVHALCRSLVAAGHEIHVFTTNVDGSADSEVPLDQGSIATASAFTISARVGFGVCIRRDLLQHNAGQWLTALMPCTSIRSFCFKPG